MGQQVVGLDEDRLPGRVAVGVLTRVFPTGLVDEVVAGAGVVEERIRVLPLGAQLALVVLELTHPGPQPRHLLHGALTARRWARVSPAGRATHRNSQDKGLELAPGHKPSGNPPALQNVVITPGEQFLLVRAVVSHNRCRRARHAIGAITAERRGRFGLCFIILERQRIKRNRLQDFPVNG